MKLYLPLFLGLTSLATTGCVLMQKTASYDGFVSDAATAQDLALLATQAADRLASTHAPGRTRLVLVRTPGTFGDAFETGLRAKGFAVFQPNVGADGLIVEYTVDKLEQEGLAPSVYARIRASDGTLFSVVRRIRTQPLMQPEVRESVPGMTIVAPPFAMPAQPPVVTERPLAETPAVAAAHNEKAVTTPEKKVDAPAILPSAPSAPPGPVASSSRPAVALSKAVLTVLPHNWRYTIPDTGRRAALVTAPGNTPWREALAAMAIEAGCEARFDNKERRVTLETTGPLPMREPAAVATGAPAGAPASAGNVPVVSALHPASLPEAAPAPVVANALREPTATPVTSTPAPTPEPEPAVVLPPQPVTPVVAEPPLAPLSAVSSELPPVKEEVWALEPGSLYSQMGHWSELAGYQLVWKAGKDLTMESAAVFQGTFLDAVKKLFVGLNKAGHGLRVVFYQSNNVMEVRGE